MPCDVARGQRDPDGGDRTARLVRRSLIDFKTARAFAAECIEKYNVKCGGPEAQARSLSGGNLQKFIVGREIMQDPKVLVVAQPTWGVDVGAAAFIRQSIIDLRNSGCAVLVISEELDELFEVCDRIAVIAKGRLSPAKPAAATNVEEIGVWMSGMWPGAKRIRQGATCGSLRPGPKLRSTMRYASPAIAVALTLVGGMLVFTALGKNPVEGFQIFFLNPVRDLNAITELLLKATPLMLIAVGLAVGFRANVWNIGAEGQFLMGAVGRNRRRTRLPAVRQRARAAQRWSSRARSAARLWAAIPALLRTRFNANEILTSLMLVYIAQLAVSWLVFGPWKDPAGFNFPQTETFTDSALLADPDRGHAPQLRVRRSRSRCSPSATSSCRRATPDSRCAWPASRPRRARYAGFPRRG